MRLLGGERVSGQKFRELVEAYESAEPYCDGACARLAAWIMRQKLGPRFPRGLTCRYYTDANLKRCVLQAEEPCEECGRYEPADGEELEVTPDCSQRR